MDYYAFEGGVVCGGVHVSLLRRRSVEEAMSMYDNFFLAVGGCINFFGTSMLAGHFFKITLPPLKS